MASRDRQRFKRIPLILHSATGKKPPSAQDSFRNANSHNLGVAPSDRLTIEFFQQFPGKSSR